MRVRLELVFAFAVACGGDLERPDAGVDAGPARGGVERCEEEPPASLGAPSRTETAAPSARVLAVADAMVSDAVVVRGGCYGYVDAVFARAGFSGREGQMDVARAPIGGRVDLDLVEPGDWLYLVNHPERTPVGTHSVLFVSWLDRDAGLAKVVSYVGGARDEPGEYVEYDVRRTYRVRRARAEE